MFTILKICEHRAVIHELSNWESYKGTDPIQVQPVLHSKILSQNKWINK